MSSESWVYLKEFLRSFDTTGAFLPSSKWLAKAITRPICEKNGDKGKKILEVGPGTGVFTREIIEHLGDNDYFAICEINPVMFRELKKRLNRFAPYHRKKEQISLHLCSILDFPEDTKFDVIVCSIPFNNMPLSCVMDIFDKLESLRKEDGAITFMEYKGFRKIKELFTRGKDRKNKKEADDFIKALSDRYATTRVSVWRNVFPANVYTLCEGREAA